MGSAFHVGQLVYTALGAQWDGEPMDDDCCIWATPHAAAADCDCWWADLTEGNREFNGRLWVQGHSVRGIDQWGGIVKMDRADYFQEMY